MIKAKVRFFMVDRTEYTFKVEGESQSDLYSIANGRLCEALEHLKINEGSDGATIEGYRTFPEAGDAPSINKKDGIAARSPLQKVRFELLPMGPLTEVAKVFTFGSFQYGDRNWEEGFSYSRCMGAIWRHFVKWSMGEDNDNESGLNHLAHVVANCLFLMFYQMAGRGTDDREIASPEFVEEMFTPINAGITSRKES